MFSSYHMYTYIHKYAYVHTYIVLYCIVLYCIVLYCMALYGIVLNHYTGTSLSPEDYFPGSSVKVEHKHAKHITQSNQLVNRSISQSAVLMVGGCHVCQM